jgi:rhomboid protease GluP
MNNPTWVQPPAPEADLGHADSVPPPAQGGASSYLPPPVPPAATFGRALPRQWIRIPVERPILTQAILAILIGIFLLTMVVGGSINAPENISVLIRMGAKVNSLVVEGDWWRLLTATLLHGGLLHIGFNGYALYMIGMDLEGFFGRLRFAAIYLVSALGGSVASFAFSPFYAVGVGASGAIFGLIGALAVYFGFNRSLFGRLGQAQFWNIIVVIVLNLVIGFSGFFPIDNSAHIGGLLTGAAIGYVLCPRYKLGDWRNPLVREVVDTNKSFLSWLAATLIALIVVAAFFVVLLLYMRGYVAPN